MAWATFNVGARIIKVNPDNVRYVIAASETRSSIHFAKDDALTVDHPIDEVEGRLKVAMG